MENLKDSTTPSYDFSVPRLRGNNFSLIPVSPAEHAELLFASANGTPEIEERVWQYLAYGPFKKVSELEDHFLNSMRNIKDALFFSVLENATNQLVGSVSYLAIVPEERRIEIGNIWYVPRAQGSGANTEINYLMLKHAFEDLGFARVEWKCNDLNKRSKAAAIKLGFKYDGLQRQKIASKGQNRDTAYFSMIEEEWKHTVKSKLEDRMALYSEQVDPIGRVLPQGSAEFPSYMKSIPYMRGARFSLTACDPATQSEELYAISHGNEATEKAVWEFMLTGPFANVEELRTYLERLQNDKTRVNYTVTHNESGRLVGMASYMNIATEHRLLEIGSIWYSPEMQGAGANTEVARLMLQHAFEQLGYERVAWRCSHLNVRSREAAVKLGFRFEGIWRNKQISKGKNRDTVYFGMTKNDWTAVKAHL